jgi:hypothetical protein
MMTPLFFSTFEVTTQAFYRASLSYAIVNLKPIVPGRKRLNIIDSRTLSSFNQMYLLFLTDLFPDSWT